MGDELDTINSVDAALTRRRLLQAGVATGVAAATWSAPKIVAAQTTPPDGAVCTVPTVTFFAEDKKNMTCESGCVDGGTPYLTYHTPYPGGGIFEINFAETIPGDKKSIGCSKPPGAPYTITFAKGEGPGPGFTCFIGSFVVTNSTDPDFKIEVTGVPNGLAPSIEHDEAVIDTCSYFYGDVTVECCPTGNFHD